MQVTQVRAATRTVPRVQSVHRAQTVNTWPEPVIARVILISCVLARHKTPAYTRLNLMRREVS
jgi:hypothetical protein